MITGLGGQKGGHFNLYSSSLDIKLVLLFREIIPKRPFRHFRSSLNIIQIKMVCSAPLGEI
jgi:hypothetical protein